MKSYYDFPTYDQVLKEKVRKKRAGDKILSYSLEEWLVVDYARKESFRFCPKRGKLIEKRNLVVRDIISMLSHNHISIPIFSTTIAMLENKDIYGHYERQMLRLKLLGEQGYEVATELARDIWWLLNKREYRRDEDEIRNDETILMFSSKPLQDVIEIDSIDELLKYA